MARLASGLVVAALMRRAQAEGGSAMLLSRGDESAGAVLVVIACRGQIARIVERSHDFDSRLVWRDTAEQVVDGTAGLDDYLARRRRTDPDLWAIELDIANVERFTAEMAAAG